MLKVNLPENNQPEKQASPDVAEEAAESFSEEFGLLTAVEMATLIGHDGDEKYIEEQLMEDRILALHTEQGLRYPAFQVNADTGSIHEVITDLIEIAEETGRTHSGLILWMFIPTDLLDDSRPVDYLDEPEKLFNAAVEAFRVKG